MSEVSAPPPEGSRVIDDRALITRDWLDWYIDILGRIDGAIRKLNTISLDDQAASIGSTSLPSASVDAGLYRVTYYIRVTQAASVSSSIAITLNWQDNTINCSITSPALTGNVVTAVMTDSALLQVDRAAALTFATTYGTVGAIPMKYKVRILLEKVP